MLKKSLWSFKNISRDVNSKISVVCSKLRDVESH
uniref:Uncharacterized protein n=1 Tax=Anguilla anguilla TaxID=7936 RepID=A0A0E9VR88_ANGAN